jgi:hypothetical protein
VWSCWLGWAVLGSPAVYAQDRADRLPDRPAEATGDPADTTDHPFEATLDLTDLWRKIRRQDEIGQPDVAAQPRPDRRFLVLAPAIGSRTPRRA